MISTLKVLPNGISAPLAQGPARAKVGTKAAGPCSAADPEQLSGSVLAHSGGPLQVAAPHAIVPDEPEEPVVPELELTLEEVVPTVVEPVVGPEQTPPTQMLSPQH
jgi:hypothetical protein